MSANTSTLRPSKHRMFLRMLLRASLVRRGRALSALLAVVVAAAVATAMLNLYVDVQAKLRTEFRKYGANIVVVARQGQPLPVDALARVQSALAGHGLAVPFAYVVASTSDGSSVVLAGTDMESVRRLDSWWSVSAWPSARGQALVGSRAAAVVSPQGQPFDLSFQGRSVHLTAAGTLTTGAAEDSRVYLPLSEFTAWTGVQPSILEIAANGSAAQVTAIMQQIAATVPGAEVRPVRQIMQAEGRVLGKTRSTVLAAAALIILTAALCVLATLTAWVLDRRRDFAIMKALGASERLISGFFAVEAASIGALGALLGYAIGIGVAAWIGRINFQASISPRLSVLPSVFLGSIVVALLSATLPMALLRRVQPATILRGE
ncbi:MAG TPA: FtsX-like permease family protein [Terriglobales bacterium]|nr:FtsX-like permease family protein [Terriglobales bacterium]